MENIKKKLSEAIKRDGEFYLLNEELNDELLYQLVYDNYFKNLTVEDIKEFVTISSDSTHDVRVRTKTASFNIKLIINFSVDDRIDLLNSYISNTY